MSNRLLWKRRKGGPGWKTPVNVKEVTWDKVKSGDLIFIAGNLVNNVPTRLYGRHIVIDPKARILKNRKDVEFYENWDTLFLEVEE